MIKLLGVATILGAFVLPPAHGQTLMQCEVLGTRGVGESAEVVYDQNNCRPVETRNVVGTETSGNSTRTIYGDRVLPALGGRQVYIMRFGDETTERGGVRYGAPLDGNPGTAGR